MSCLFEAVSFCLQNLKNLINNMITQKKENVKHFPFFMFIL